MMLPFAVSARWRRLMKDACVVHNRYDEELMAEWNEAPPDEL